MRRCIRDELRKSGLTQGDLLDKAGLTFDQSQLTRKLAGGQPLSAEHAIALADALGLKTSGIARLSAMAAEVGAELCWPAEKRETDRPRKRRAA